MMARRSVSFGPQVAVYFTLHLNDFSDREVKATWYKRDDIATIKAECTATVTMILKAQPLRTDLYCARGLEFRTPRGLQRRQANKRNAIDVVLDEQDRQIDQNIHDAKKLATVYHQVSVRCHEAAHQLGLHDERFVRTMNYVQSDSKTKTNFRQGGSLRKKNATSGTPKGKQIDHTSQQNVVSAIEQADEETRRKLVTSAAA
jgi:hypothetical protein